MSRVHTREIADRRALLATRAELDRTRMMLVIHEVKAIVAPPPDPARVAAMRPAVRMIVGIAASAVGIQRFGRWLRIASWVLVAARVARNWRSAR